MGAQWTAAELARAAELVRAGLSYRRVAAELGRPHRGTVWKLRLLGLRTPKSARRARPVDEEPPRPTRDDMTDAELDAVIAEQSRPENLPPWWWEHVEVQRQWDAEAGRLVAEAWEWSAVVVRGRGLSKVVRESQ